MPISREEEQALKILQDLATEIDGLMDAIGDKRSFSRPEKQALQNRFKSFKERMKSIIDECRVLERQGQLPEAYQTWVVPEVEEASSRIRARSNSDPIRSGWYSELYDAHGDITFYLYQLIKMRDE